LGQNLKIKANNIHHHPITDFILFVLDQHNQYSVPLIKAEKFKNIVPSFNFDKEGVLMHVLMHVLAFLCEFISVINPDRTSSNAFSSILKKAEWNGLEILACAAGIYHICSRRFNLNKHLQQPAGVLT
jgi:hypothetical protein